MCGGVIVSCYHVITTAHCTLRHGSAFSTIPAEQFVLFVGDVYYTQTCNTKVFSVGEVHRHEKYKFNKFINDIAVLKVNLARNLRKL